MCHISLHWSLTLMEKLRLILEADDQGQRGTPSEFCPHLSLWWMQNDPVSSWMVTMTSGVMDSRQHMISFFPHLTFTIMPLGRESSYPILQLKKLMFDRGRAPP